MKTVVGLFSTSAEAQRVKQALVAEGYSSANISVHASDFAEDEGEGTGYNETASTPTPAHDAGTGIGQKISNFFSSLTGGDDSAHEHYAQGVNGGGALLSVKAEDDQATSVATLLRQHGAREIEGATGTSDAYADTTSSTRGTDALATGTQTETTGQAIPIIEEELVVGKREVDRGGVRVYSHVVERPVSAEVSLHNESIDISRRAVSRPATAADFQTASQPIELRASGEEVIVGKAARVVEEVHIGKQGSDRTETVNDTVRKTEVDVEQIPATTERTGSYTDPAIASSTTTKERF